MRSAALSDRPIASRRRSFGLHVLVKWPAASICFVTLNAVVSGTPAATPSPLWWMLRPSSLAA
jgi:hypothetical protein